MIPKCPYPNCGGRTEIRLTDPITGDWSYFVECVECGACGPRADNKDTAVTRWEWITGALYRLAELEEQRDDLLAACQSALDCFGESSNWNGETEKFLRLVESAVAKATGGE